MKKHFQKTASIFMTCVLLLQTSLTAFAAGTGEVFIETTPGKTETVVVEVSTQTNESITETVSDAKGYITADGLTVDYSSTETTTEKVDGTSTQTFNEEYKAVDTENAYIAQGGSESTQSVTAPHLVVEIPLKDTDDPNTEADETTRTKTGDAAGTSTRTGDEKTSADDGDFDYIETSVVDQSGITIKTNKVERKETVNTTGHEFEYVYNNLVGDDQKELLSVSHLPVLPTGPADVPTIKDGYEYVLLGINTLSMYWLARNYTSTNIAEDPIYTTTDGRSFYARYDHNYLRNSRHLALSGIYVDGEYIPAPPPAEGKAPITAYFPAQYGTVQSFWLSDKKGNIVSTYCADEKTTTEDGFSYIMQNVEDADYYDTEDVDNIETVAWHGYWGAKSDTGSMAVFKQGLRDSGNFTEEELAAITEGMAMTATQYAIWHFSNKQDEYAFLNSFYMPVNRTPTVNKVFSPAKEKSDLIMKMYYHLIGLEPAEDHKNSDNTIINKQNFLAYASLEIKDKPMDNPLNNDADINNDAYTADISFALVAKPRTIADEEKSDSLFVTVTDGEGNVLAEGRVAGELAEGETMLFPEEGEYTFENIPVKEGTQTLRFFMNGEQYIEKGVYLYTSEIAPNADGEVVPSQTMVGIASGKRNVNVNTDVSFDFTAVDEKTQTQRVWRQEKSIAPVTVDIVGEKYFDNTAGSGFTFALYDKDGNEIERTYSEEDGSFRFTQQEFTKPDTYTFTVKEVAGDNPAIIYDDTVYTCTYTVELVNDELVITDSKIEGGQEDRIVFENRTYTPVEVTLGGSKLLGDSAGEGFVFELYQDDYQLSTAVSDAQGNFEFIPVSINSSGTYYYTIRETDSGREDVIYDNTVFTAVVTVETDGEQLSVTDIEYLRPGEDGNNYPVDSVVFNNTPVTPAQVQFTAEKTLDGTAAEGFVFILSNEYGNIETVVSDADGKIEFTPITCNETGTYVYSISEYTGEDDLYNYDYRVYTATVTVEKVGTEFVAT
ncbi:MAG: Cys-Gln thioester bond-forming surface protein, partial [Oscillospiraceae bacterium]|nr:Cys-Gln thioester bond-forming surface protein [Oscillospiraceae bacterium]